MIVGDKEYKWIIEGTHCGIPNENIHLYHSEKRGITAYIDEATQYDSIGDAMRKAIYRNDRDTGGFTYRIIRQNNYKHYGKKDNKTNHQDRDGRSFRR